jgi:hypothetical protein
MRNLFWQISVTLDELVAPPSRLPLCCGIDPTALSVLEAGPVVPVVPLYRPSPLRTRSAEACAATS